MNRDDILFLSPHSDDESLFGAYTLIRRKPRVVICTDANDPGMALTRRRESMKAARLAGCRVEFLGIREKDLNENTLTRALQRYSPTKVYAPFMNSKHPHHVMVGSVAQELWGSKMAYYSTYTHDSLVPHGQYRVTPNRSELNMKRDMLHCYHSQHSDPGIVPHFIAVNEGPEFLNLINPPGVTACLVKWERERELEQIVEHLNNIPFVSNIVIHHNTPDDNQMDYGRFLAASKSTNDIIFVQDDDYLVHNIGELYATFDGECMSNNVEFGRMAEYGPDALSSVVGWGAFFKKEWLALFDAYKELYGEDYILRREAGRIFSVLCKGRNTLPVFHDTNIQPFVSSTSPTSLYHQPDHWICRAIAVGRALELRYGNSLPA